MSSMIVKPPDDEHAYEQIEAAVMETSRGRWFLSEFARRNRHAESMIVLDAIARLQKTLGHRSPAFPQDRLQADIIEMARAIARTEREIRAIKHEGDKGAHFVSAPDELDAVVGTTEQATSTILSAAERVQEFAWTLRERSGDAAECELLDACATEIYTACGFQDLTAQRIRKVVETLRFLDQRLKTILQSAGLDPEIDADEAAPAEPNGQVVPSLRASDIWMSDASQAEVDDTFEFFEPAAVAEPTMVGAELLDIAPDKTPALPRATPLVLPSTPYDALPTAERLRAFR